MNVQRITTVYIHFGSFGQKIIQASIHPSNELHIYFILQRSSFYSI